jgi:uncharacterized ferritin-like protein (DUF455 family)
MPAMSAPQANKLMTANTLQLLADNPFRDSRFKVAERWSDCTNLAEDDPLREIEFFHRQMNEEVDSLECSARNLSDFPDTPWELRMSLARQCVDEARHARMFRRIFESRGGRVGEYPVINFQYRIVMNLDSLISRLAVQNRSFEAGGLDAIKSGIELASQNGDEELVALYEAQVADEISHVRFANDWIRRATADDPRTVLQIGAALNQATEAFQIVMGSEATDGVHYPADVSGRQEAGFTDQEVEQAIQLQERHESGGLPNSLTKP